MSVGQIKTITYLIFAMTRYVSGTADTGSPVQMAAGEAIESGYAPVNGIKMYYEVHGKGEGTPLVLLHGGGSRIDVTFSKVLPIFAQHRKVIAVEEQGHGRTTESGSAETAVDA